MWFISRPRLRVFQSGTLRDVLGPRVVRWESEKPFDWGSRCSFRNTQSSRVTTPKVTCVIECPTQVKVLCCFSVTGVGAPGPESESSSLEYLFVAPSTGPRRGDGPRCRWVSGIIPEVSWGRSQCTKVSRVRLRPVHNDGGGHSFTFGSLRHSELLPVVDRFTTIHEITLQNNGVI